MKKKIIAALVALLMTASALPLSDVVPQLSTYVGISATAASTIKGSVSVKNYNDEAFTIEYNTNKDTQERTYLKVTVPNYFFPNEVDLTIDTTNIQEAIMADIQAQDKSLEGVEYVELAYKFNAKRGSALYHSKLSHVTFSSKDTFINKIGQNAFNSIPTLQSLTLNSSITMIGGSAFSSCKNFAGNKTNNTLELVNVKEIDSGAFSGCSTITGLKLGSKLTSMGDNAFSGCTGLKNVTIPKSVDFIGKNVFSADTALEKVVFEKGSALTSLGEKVFAGCTLLSKVLYGDGTDNTLPPKVTDVGKGVFSQCKALQKFTINKNLGIISTEMFAECTSLQNVYFETGTKCFGIDSGAFNKCSSLVEIELPDAVVILAIGTFENCTNLKKVIVSDDFISFGPTDYDTDYALCKLKCGTFAGCPVLSLAPKSKAKQLKANQIIVPDKVTYIPSLCFEGCTGLTSIKMPNITDIGDGAFKSCTGLVNLTIPDAVTTLRKDLCNGCAGLKKLIYSKKLGEIGEAALKNCKSLTNATPNGTTEMKNTIILPATCGGIQKSGLEGSTSFKYLNIIDGGKGQFSFLGESALAGCTSLEGSTKDGTSNQELSFPKGLVVIPSKAFTKCNSLLTVKFAGNVTSIGEYAFQDCTSLVKATMNSTIQQIGASAFRNCTSLLNVPVTTKGTSAFTQLDEIKAYTFAGCTSLGAVDIGSATQMTAIRNNAFDGCKSMTRLTLPANGALASIGDSAFVSCSSLAVVADSATATKSKIPNSVASIGKNAFSGTALTDMTIVKPKDKTAYNTIGDGAFSNCASLKSVDLSGSNLIELGKSLFANDKQLVSAKLPTTLTAIGDSAFSDCVKLSTINSTTKGEAKLPTNLKTISNLAFKDAHCISRMVIPAETDHISLSAWNFSIKYTQEDIDKGIINPLKEIVVDSNNANYKSVNGVLYTKDGSELLMYPVMKAGKKFEVPSTVTHITQSAFSSNNILETVTIPASVVDIAASAFNKCESLKAVYYGNNKTIKFADTAFSGLTGNPKVVFYAAKGSTAEAYAKKNSKVITFIDNSMIAANLYIQEGDQIAVSRSLGRFQLTPVITTKDGKPTTDVLVWTSSNTAIATVDNEGYVTPKTNGTAVIKVVSSTGLTDSIKVVVGDTAERLAGSNRYATAAAISTGAFNSAKTVIIANGRKFADALAGGTLALAYDAPILLTEADSLPADTLAEIQRLGATNAIILGGSGSVGQKVKDELMKNHINYDLVVKGKTKYATAVEIAKATQTKTKKDPTEIFFVSADKFADALSVSAVAAKKGAPIIYLPKTGSIDADTAAYLKSVKGKIKNAYVIGGSGVIGADVMAAAGKALGLTVDKTIVRVKGSTKYETCIAVNKKFASVLSGTTLCVATGENFPDALAGGVFAAKQSAPLFLVNKNAKSLDSVQTAYLKEKAAKKFYVFGGEGAVPTSVVNQIIKVK